jgi:hypothetical protein
MKAHAITVTFIPADPNADPGHVYAFADAAKARAWIADDAAAYMRYNLQHGDTGRAHAYALTAAEAAHPGAAEGRYDVTVVRASDPATLPTYLIGTYALDIIHEGDAHPCHACNAPGRVTAIHRSEGPEGRADAFATCDACHADYAARWGCGDDACATCGQDAWTCAAHHGDAHSANAHH